MRWKASKPGAGSLVPRTNEPANKQCEKGEGGQLLLLKRGCVAQEVIAVCGPLLDADSKKPTTETLLQFLRKSEYELGL